MKVFGDRKLEKIGNPRLLNLKEKTLPFRFKIIQTSAQKHKLPKEPSKIYLPDHYHEYSDALTTLSIRDDIVCLSHPRLRVGKKF